MGSDGEEESHDSMSPSTVQLLMSSTLLKEKKLSEAYQTARFQVVHASVTV